MSHGQIVASLILLVVAMPFVTSSFLKLICATLQTSFINTDLNLTLALQGKKIELPPQAQSMLFNESLGLVRAERRSLPFFSGKKNQSCQLCLLLPSPDFNRVRSQWAPPDLKEIKFQKRSQIERPNICIYIYMFTTSHPVRSGSSLGRGRCHSPLFARLPGSRAAFPFRLLRGCRPDL